MTNQVHDVLTTNQLNTMCQTLTPGTLVAFDVETTGLDPYAHGASVVSLAITTQDETTWVVPLDHPEGPWGFRWRDVLGTIANTLSSCRIIAHNAQFDVRWVTQHTRPSVDLSDAIIIDTLILAHLLNENRSKKLKELAAPLMGGTSWAIEGVARAQSVPWFELSKYNALDTIATMRLAKELVEDSKSQPRVAALHKEIVAPAARALTRVTARGILLDRKMAIECAITAKQESSVAGARLMSTARGYGMDPDAPGVNVSWEPTAKWYRQFMDLAVATGDIVVVETTATGASSWRAGVMKKLADTYPLAGVILAYRHGAKQGQFIRSWQETAGLDGRVHATFNVGRTRTGRLSSSDPNMQQVSRELKHCFTARPGWKFVEIDYSQIELRIIAEFIHRFVEPDNPMLQAYLDDRDLHRENAALVTGGAPEDVSDDDRQSGKAVGFGYCLSGTEPVDTERGPVIIRDVKDSDRVWDGEEWVTHEGVVMNGVKETIWYDGVRATPNHYVFTNNGGMCHAAASATRSTLIRSKPPVTDLHAIEWMRTNAGQAPTAPSRVLSMFAALVEGRVEPEESGGHGVQDLHQPVEVPRPGQGSDRGAGRTVRRSGSEVSFWWEDEQELWGPGYREQVRLTRGVHPMVFLPVGESGHHVDADRQGGQRGPLRAGELTSGDPVAEHGEHSAHPLCAVHGEAGCPVSRMAFDEDGPSRSALQSWLDNQTVTGRGAPRAGLAAGAHWQREDVYDIVNAGPRHRFTVRRRLVSNCFGMGAAGFVTYAAESYGVDFTLDHATQVRNEYFKRWSGLGEWHNHQRALAKKQGFVENLMGRRRRLPAIYGERSYDQGEAERQAINSPIQATASDLMLFALARIEELPRDEVVVVGTVHDSVLLEVKSAWCIDKVCGLLLESPVQLTVPVAVEASIGDRWGVYEDKFTRSTR